MAAKKIYKDKQTALKAHYRQVASYNRRDRVGISFRLDKEDDKDIIDYLATVDNKVDFFRRIIREEIKKNG